MIALPRLALIVVVSSVIFLACGPDRERERSYVGPLGHAPAIYHYLGPDVCRSKEIRDERFDEGDLVVLVPMLVDAEGALAYRDIDFGSTVRAEQMPQPSWNEFSAFYFPAGTSVADRQPLKMIEGTFILDGPPDYDTGSFRGTYDLVFEDDTRRSGILETHYCPSDPDVDHEALASDLDHHCRLAFGEIYSPGSSNETYLRDQARGLRARGVDTPQAACLRSLIECCREDAGAPGGPLDGNAGALALGCVEASNPEPIECPME
jgi:hypothetical protein